MEQQETQALPVNEQYQGSKHTVEQVRKILQVRYNLEEAEKYTPDMCRTFRSWLSIGYRVRKGEKAIPIVFAIPRKPEDENQSGPVIRKANLFYIKQVEKIS
jgi:antirestriction protein ArdC